MLKKLKSMGESNWSILAAGLFGLGAIACPCPLCIGGTITLFLNWIWEKIWNRL